MMASIILSTLLYILNFLFGENFSLGSLGRQKQSGFLDNPLWNIGLCRVRVGGVLICNWNLQVESQMWC